MKKVLTLAFIVWALAGCSNNTPKAEPSPTSSPMTAYDQGIGTRVMYEMVYKGRTPTPQDCSDLYNTSVENGTKEDFMNGCLGG